MELGIKGNDRFRWRRRPRRADPHAAAGADRPPAAAATAGADRPPAAAAAATGAAARPFGRRLRR